MENQMTASQAGFPQQAVQSHAGGMLAVAATREAQTIQAQMVIAQRFPRNQTQAYSRIIEACKRKHLAEKALYAYQRGGQLVSGPSIRLAEVLAQNWGNLDCGIRELETKPSTDNKPGESVMEAYTLDLETNVRYSLTFTVRHKRDTKKGSYNLTDDRDIYEMTANQGSRRLRATILKAIPGDIVEAAIEECEKAMAGGQGPLIDRIRAMVVAFNDMSVTQAMLEKRLGHKIEATTEKELVDMKKIFQSIRDGFAGREEYFDVAATETAHAADLNSRGAPPVQQPMAPAQAAAAASAPTAPAAPAPAKAAAPKPKAKPKAEAPAPEAPAPTPAPEAQAADPEQPPVDLNWEPPMEEAPAPAVAMAPAAPGDFTFAFGGYTGKKLKELTTDQLTMYVNRLKGSQLKDEPQVVEAVEAIEKYLAMKGI